MLAVALLFGGLLPFLLQILADGFPYMRRIFAEFHINFIFGGFQQTIVAAIAILLLDFRP